MTLSPNELIEKLAALVPPPTQNLVRFHGVLAPHTKNRAAYVQKKPPPEELEKTQGKSANRLLWAALLARTFNLHLEVCRHCGGKTPAHIFASQSCYTGVHFCFAKDEV
ncbi:MAG: transposase, partial [Deltaproteobacteria bacterium]|nr:transposase [Deltaproteobacteria bacterium]